MQVAYGLYGHQPMMITYSSCGKKAVEKLTRYHTRIRTIPTEGPCFHFHDDQLNSYHYLKARICFQTIILKAGNFGNDFDDSTLRMSCSYTIFCGQTRVLGVRFV